MVNKYFNRSFWLVAVLQLIAVFIGFDVLALATKPLLMILLIGYYISGIKGKKTKIHYLIIFGFMFSWSGDVNLMFVDLNEQFFLFGLASFLVTHLLYSAAFIIETREDGQSGILKKQPYLVIPFLIILIILLYIVFDNLGEFMIPVVVYSSVITFMVLAALNRKHFVSQKSFDLVFTGALLFMLSDSVIAINKFYQPFELSHFIIMSTYISGQYLIANGLLKAKLI